MSKIQDIHFLQNSVSLLISVLLLWISLPNTRKIIEVEFYLTNIKSRINIILEWHINSLSY